MPRPPFRPTCLPDGPFTTQQAYAAGLTRRQLQGRSWRRVWPHVYVAATTPITPELTLRGVLLTLPREYNPVFCGLTAAWLHALADRLADPVQVNIGEDHWATTRYRVQFRRNRLPETDVTVVRALPVTTLHRTLFDLARQLGTTEATVHVDTALRLQLTSLASLEEDAERRCGHKGVRRYRKVVGLADEKSESPMETRLRLLLVTRGLPAPQSQVELPGPTGAVIARVDFYYPERRLAIEYDGAQHREQLTADNRRQNSIVGAGYRLLRFSAPDLAHPQRVVETVRAALVA